MPRQSRRKRFPFNVLHRDEVNAVRFLDGVDRHDVRVIQGGDRLRFPREPTATFFVLRKFGRQDLEGNVSVQLGVLG